ncbi:MAG: hypothetical protein J5706_01365, partial [Elusimicrobiales bacterium]|nr:hypothetical protein [Elusimicrobiales bacterium]
MANIANAADLNIHYNRLGTTDNWNLWVWGEGKDGFEVRPSGNDKFGMLFKVDLKQKGIGGNKIGVLPRRGQWEAKDEPERYYNDEGQSDIYLLEGDGEVYFAPPEVSTKATAAWLDDGNEVRLIFSRAVSEEYVSSLKLSIKEGKKSYPAEYSKPTDGGNSSKGWICRFKGWKPDFMKTVTGSYSVSVGELGNLPVSLGTAVYGKDFVYQGKLGAIIENGKTTIRIFAPKASSAKIKLMDKTSGNISYDAMSKKKNGIWEKTYGKDMTGMYYRIVTVQNGKEYEGLDPYAECVTNDDGYAYIGKENTHVADSPKFDWADSVLYEVHLRDLTIHPNSGAENKGHYLGAAQT